MGVRAPNMYAGGRARPITCKEDGGMPLPLRDRFEILGPVVGQDSGWVRHHVTPRRAFWVYPAAEFRGRIAVAYVLRSCPPPPPPFARK